MAYTADRGIVNDCFIPRNVIQKIVNPTETPLDALLRIPIARLSDLPEPAFKEVIALWLKLRPQNNGLPEYRLFDPLHFPPRIWPFLFVSKLIGTPRRFFYELAGGEIERHNGFSIGKKFLNEIPLKNRAVMAGEFGRTVRLQVPVYTESPYIGAADYIKRAKRVITPYRLSEREYAFVCMAMFEPFQGREHLVRMPHDSQERQ